MATFVLVHGACLGGWYWARVSPLLRSAGHDVYTPTLTGLGERSHLSNRDIDLDTHVQDIENVLKFEDLSNVILLGHSYGGMVITGVAERVPERLSQLIYLDADVPADGQNMYALETPQDSASYKEFVRTKGEGWWWMPPVEGLSDFSRPRAVRQPIKTFEQPIQINNPEATKVPRTFILCTIGRGGQQGADRALSEPSWRYRELNANHGANAVSKPSDLVNMLLELI